MSVAYWVLGSDELMTQPDLQLPEGLRLTEPVSVQVATSGPEFPSSHWYRFEDDNAPAELEDKRVGLILCNQDGKPVILERVLLP